MVYKNLDKVRYKNQDWFVMEWNEELGMMQLIRYGVLLWVFDNEVTKI